ncbi:hypothetical protein BsWGS_26501 [Bradybaena similaris]
MWKNWSLFKRRTEDASTMPVDEDVTMDGKENTTDMRGGGLGGNGSSRSFSGERTSKDVHGQNGGYARHQIIGQSPGASLRRPAPSPFMPSDSSNLPRSDNEREKYDGMNKSFSGVYGPLLSSPLVPKVRRALESSAGLKSPQTRLLTRGTPIGRSSSLNYGSGNPAKSTAGTVPWVRLKRKESFTLTDIANGTTPQSPNTVKLAAPEPRHLPAAPSFKTTPLIVTTEHSRARVVDTQAVVLALREKRKRFGSGHREESFSEDSWINAAKRRRQDSSQSNASSVSIPSMPESLPDLMGTPGVSLLHIENLKDQRPSAIPVMDAFVSRHQREFGLGGDMIGQSPQLQVYNQPQVQEVPGARQKQSSKSVLRSIQSSLSSSLRARANLSTLQNSGLDLTRIRQMPEGHDAVRRVTVNFDKPAIDQRSMDTQAKVSTPTAVIAAAEKTASNLTDRSTPGGSMAKSVTPLSVQRQKIAEGVVLKKQNVSLNSTSTPVKSKQMMPLNMLISTNDIEQDRQKEYKRRVLDLLDEDESAERPDTSSAPSLTITVAPMTSSTPAAITSFGLPVNTAVASAATAAAVSASLDSLNKLVQSAAAGPGASLSATGSVTTPSTNSLAQGSLSSGGHSLTTSSAACTLNKEVSFGFNASTQPPQTANSDLPSTATASSTGGFQFGASSSASSVESTQSTPAATTGGFQINFSTASAPLGTSSIAAASVASSPSAGAGQPASSGGLNFNFGSTSSSQPNTGIFGSTASSQAKTDIFGSTASPQPNAAMFGSALGGQQSTNSFNFGSVPVTQTSTSSGMPATSAPVFSGVTQPTASSPASGVNQFTSTLQNPDFSFKPPSAQTAAATTQAPLSTGGIFGSGMSQPAAPSTLLPLSSTLQAFATAQSKDDSSFTKPATSGMMAQGFALSTTPFSTAAPPTSNSGLFNFGTPSTAAGSTSTPGLFNFGAPNTTASLSGGFAFGNSGVGTTQQGSATGMSSAAAPSTAAAAAASTFGFNFGSSSALSTAPPQQPSGLSFGATSASSLPTSSGLTSGGFTGQPSFAGFGSNTQTNSTTTAFTSSGLQPQSFIAPTTSVPTSQPFGSGGASAFGSSLQTSLAAQQSFSASTAAPGLSMFGGTATTTTTNSTGIFNFGQTSAPTSTSTNNFAFGPSSTSGAFPKPFAFGTATTQSGTGFGGTTITSSSVFGNIVSPMHSAGTTSVFGGGKKTKPAFDTSSVTSPFGTSSVTSPFGSSVQATSAPMFGSSVPTTAPPAFGSMVPTTSPPAFGSMVPTTSPPAFGSAVNTPMFGAANSQTSSMFGTAAPSSRQLTSAFGAPASSSNQLFTFGAGSGSQTASQSAPTFGSNPSGTFGAPAAAGSSMFGAKPAAPAFSTATANPASMFGTPVQSPASATSPAFGSSFGMSTTFGAPSNTNKPTFGAASSGFGTSAASSFGASPQSSAFGAAPQNSAQNLFGIAPQNPPPAFGSQPSSVQTVASNPFGGAGSAGATAFGAAKPSPFGATTTSQANFNFASNQPNMFSSPPANSGFNFQQPSTQPGASNLGFNFTAQTPTRPTLPAPSPGAFNFAATAAGSAPAFNFSATPSTPNPFSPQAPGAAPRPRAAARRATRRGGPRR